MSEEFKPYSSPIPIAGTSYSAQIGKNSEDQWTIRLIKANKIVETESFDELNGNLMVGFILRATAIPMLNPYKISQNVKMLITQADRGPLQIKPVAPAAAPAVAPAPAAGSAIESLPAGSLTAGISRTSEYDVPSRIGTAPTFPSQTIAPAAPAETSGSNCSQCNSPIQANWNLCAFCGFVLKKMHCPGCSKEINFSFKLCPFCGIKLPNDPYNKGDED